MRRNAVHADQSCRLCSIEIVVSHSKVHRIDEHDAAPRARHGPPVNSADALDPAVRAVD